MEMYYHKTVKFSFMGKDLRFRTSQQLFSSHDIDTGTRFLLRTIVEAGYPPFERILDVGCGYGPLGLTLKSLYPTSMVHLFDREALAVEYTRQNAALNGLDGVGIYGSLGYDDVKRNDFDLIIANIPDHAGENVITYLLQEARYYLAPGGLAAVVVVTPLEELVVKILAETPGAEITLKRNRSGHAVFHYRFSDTKTPPQPEPSAFERGVYHRQEITMRLEKLEYKMQTADGLPEFDSLSYGSEILVKALGQMGGGVIKNALVFNPGQGHVAVALWKYLKPESIVLVDRDLLALRYARLNLVLNGCPPDNINIFHQVGLDMEREAEFDLVLGSLREDEGKEAAFLLLDQASGLLADKGAVMISAGSTAITRITNYVRSQGLLRVKRRERRRGYGLLALERLDRKNQTR
ncbi:MAG: methyltransferase [Dehalococcoidales bacterium]|nr:methyltransferase [Dehalococcoidales bacterium]